MEAMGSFESFVSISLSSSSVDKEVGTQWRDSTAGFHS